MNGSDLLTEDDVREIRATAKRLRDGDFAARRAWLEEATALQVSILHHLATNPRGNRGGIRDSLAAFKMLTDVLVARADLFGAAVPALPMPRPPAALPPGDDD